MKKIQTIVEMKGKTEPCSCAVAEDMIKLLLARRETGGGHIGVLQICRRKQCKYF